MLNIFDYSDYKLFLRDTLATFPKKGHGQIARIAEHLAAHPTLVSQVLNGDRDFSAEQIYKLCNYLGLQALETDFLIILLQYERAGTAEFKKYYNSKLQELKKASLNIASRMSKEKTLTEIERAVFYSSWIYLATWLFTSVNDGQSLEAVAHKFLVPRKQAAELLSFLRNAGLCEEVNGIYKMKNQHIHLEFGSAFLGRHHANWRVKSLQRIDDIAEDEMLFTSPFSVSKKDFLRIREELMKVIKSTSAIIKDSPAEDIACLNLDLFWILK